VLRKSSMIASSQVFKAKFSDSGLMRSSLHKSQLVLWDVMEPDSLDEHSNDSPVADQWISDEVVELLEGERDRAFDSSQRSAAVGDASAFGESQNQAMLLKFFLEQARGSVPPRQKTRALVDRDFGRWENFRASWTALAIPPAVHWIVLGLSFADFRFHLFPVGPATSLPFCVSPISCWCLIEELQVRINVVRERFINVEWLATDWGVVESRIDCLEEPLDVFSDPVDCFCKEGSCLGDNL
jgi:hypothetical protein